MQTRKQSLTETIVNYIFGYILAVLTQLVIFPIYHMQVSLISNLQITLWFTIVSIIRNYLIRRYYNKRHAIQNKEEINTTMTEPNHQELLELEKHICVCTAIECPWYKNKACNKYTTSGACHLTKYVKDFGLSFITPQFDNPDAYNNQYAIFLRKRLMDKDVESKNSKLEKVTIPLSQGLKAFNDGWVMATEFINKTETTNTD